MTEPRRAPDGSLEGSAAARVGRLFRRHGRMVYGLCRLVLRDPGEAEDAAQQTFLSAHRALLAGIVPRDDAAWLTTIARNECRSRNRARKESPLPLLEGVVAAEATSHDTAVISEEVEELKAALRELPDKQREAVLLRDVFGLRYGEIAVVLDSSRPAVEALLFRARRQLRGRLKPLRDAAAGFALPPSLREALETAIPSLGASGSAAGAVAAGAGIAKLGAPAAAKVAAAALAVGTAGTVGVAEVGRGVADAPADAKSDAAPSREVAPAEATARSVDAMFVELAAEPVARQTARATKSKRIRAARIAAASARPVATTEIGSAATSSGPSGVDNSGPGSVSSGSSGSDNSGPGSTSSGSSGSDNSGPGSTSSGRSGGDGSGSETSSGSVRVDNSGSGSASSGSSGSGSSGPSEPVAGVPSSGDNSGPGSTSSGSGGGDDGVDNSGSGSSNSGDDEPDVDEPDVDD